MKYVLPESEQTDHNTEVISIIGIINSFISQFCLSSRALHFN